jgi:hypothetical protein
MLRSLLISPAVVLLLSTQSGAADLRGPGRFCGYAPIIDLLPGESVTILEGQIHGGSFRWEGAFGKLTVHGVGWASRPKGRIVEPGSAKEPTRFGQHREGAQYEIAIWNGAHAAAYFSSDAPFNALQIAAIRRVKLFEEGQAPSDCKLRTVFSWEEPA